MLTSEMAQALEQYARHIQKSYDDWHTRMKYELKSINVTWEVGNKYIRVLTNDGQRMAHSFIFNDNDDGKFVYGDILKVASWKAPAKNQARGNIFKPETWGGISWTGTQYLK